MTANSLHRNLVLDIRGRNIAIKPGETTLVERELVLRNRSDRTITVDLWIEPSDAKATALRQWCRFSEINPKVPKGEERRVQLLFEIPSLVEPGFYSYDVCAQSPQFVEEIERRPQKLEVLTSDQVIDLRNEPEFYLTPSSSSEQPYQLMAGSTFTAQVTVENQSKRVDRLFLSCPELASDWFDVVYPDEITNAPGRIIQTDGLQLNPDSSGLVTKNLHPPRLTPAGHYSTTLRLTSANQNSLVLLDIIYFTIQSNDDVSVTLEPKVGHIPGEDSEFSIILKNVGNVRRDLTVSASDEDHVFNYRFSKNSLELAPGEIGQLLITPRTSRWWRRQWKKRQDVPFTVEFTNTAAPVRTPELLLTEAQGTTTPLLKVPEPVTGKIIWEARPDWLRWLLIALLIAGVITGAAVISYWLVKKLVVDPSLKPKVLEFSTPAESYKALVKPSSSSESNQTQGQNPILLDWEVSNADKLDHIDVTFFARNRKAELADTLEIEQLIAQPECRKETRVVGPLLRLLYPIYKENTETNVLICQGLVLPLAGSADTTTANKPKVNGQESNEFAFDVDAYDITQQLYPLPQETDSSSSERSSDGAYSEEPLSDTSKLSNVQITLADPPKILYFNSKTTTYREQSADRFISDLESAEVSSLESPESLAADSEAEPVNISAQLPSTPIRLTWIIENPWEIEELILEYVAVTFEGNALSRRLERYEIASNNEPVQLQGACEIEQAKWLVCRDVPMPLNTAGEYTFKLKALMPAEQDRDEIAMDSDPIVIRPPFPNILSFMLNGQQAADQPQQVQFINPARGSVDVMLEWEVENADRMKVELLPAPGLVGADTTSMSYAISPTPGSTNLTLQVTNGVGEMVSRTVAIATAMPSETVRPIVPVPVEPPRGIPLPPPPIVVPSGELEPIQIPPSGN